MTYPNGNTGTSVTVRASGLTTSANGTVTASFSVNGIPYTITHPVWVGVPSTSQFDIRNVDIDGNFLMEGMYNQLVANDFAYQNGTIDWEWDCGGWDHIDVTSTKMISYVDVPYSFSYQDIKVRLDNTCGESAWYTERFYPYEGYFLMLSPNPSTSETTVSIETTSKDAQSFDETAEWDLEVFNQGQLLKTKKTKLKGKEYTLNTSGWKEGVYAVRVKYRNEILIGKLVVKR